MERKFLKIGTSVMVCIFEDSDVMTIDNTHKNFSLVHQLIIDPSVTDDEIKSLMSTKKAVESWSKGDLVIEGGGIYYEGMPIHNALADKIIIMMEDGDKGFKRFAKFLRKTLENGSYKTRQRLMEFAAANNIEIADNGNILAFKNTDSEGNSKHAGLWEKDKDGKWKYDSTERYNHYEGGKCEMPRSEVDDYEDRTCSAGLHICSLEYLRKMWGTSGKNWLVQVNPKDIVAIPPDYNNSKARTCKYRVVEEIEDILSVMSAYDI